MSKKNIFLYALIVLFSAGSILRAGDINQTKEKSFIKRYAVVLGANNGGRDRIKLRYAVADAREVSQVLQELGGVLEEDNLLLLNPDVRAFYTEMGKLHARMKKAREGYSRIEVIFY